MHIEPYLHFNGRCEEAIEFYQRALGARVLMLMRTKDSPQPASPGELPPGSDNKVLHASLRIGKSTVMASDGDCAGQPEFRGFSLSIATDTVRNTVYALAARVYALIADSDVNAWIIYTNLYNDILENKPRAAFSFSRYFFKDYEFHVEALGQLGTARTWWPSTARWW